MRLQTRLAHDLMEQFVEWHRIPDRTGPKQAVQPFVRLMQQGYRSTSSGPSLAPWFDDDYASLVNKMLMNLKRAREFEFKVLMHYYFEGQRQDITGERFRCHRNKVREIVGSALDHLDGQISAIAA